MPDDTEQSTENDSTQNSSTQNSGAFATGGKKIVIGIDVGGMDDQGYLDTVAKGLEDCGNEVTKTSVSPNQEGLMQGKGADLAVFLTNGIGAATYWSFSRAIKAGSLPFTVFMSEGWYHTNGDPDSPMASLENARKTPYTPEHDADQFMGGSGSSQNQQMQTDGSGAQTVGDFFDANSEYMALCWAATPEEAIEQLCSGGCGGGGSGSVANAGGGAQIKDKTFEKCIRRVCAATDSVFLVENNAAILFPYTDWLVFTLRQKINTITPKEIDPSVFSMEYNNEGFYNKVTIAWGETELPERTFDTTPQTNYKQNEKTTTIMNKGITTQELSTDTDGTTLLSEQYDSLVEKYGVLEKRVQSKAPDYETAQYLVNALLIQYVRDFNNSCQCRAISNRKYMGGTFYNVTNPFTSEQEMLYLNSYTMRTQKGAPLYFDLEFKYGPESAEDVLDYQFLTGGSAAGGSGTVGGEAADINALAQQICQGKTTEMDKLNAVHDWLRTNITYSGYSCTNYDKDPVKCLQNKDHLNCADTSNLSRAVFSASGLNATVVHGDNHFWTVVTIGGKEYASDAVHSSHALGDVWQPSGTSHFNNGGPYYKKCGKTSCC